MVAAAAGNGAPSGTSVGALTTDFLQATARVDAALAHPRVRAVHLPPVPVEASLRGEFCAVELDDGSVGLSYVLLDDTLRELHAHDPTLALAGWPALDVAALYAPPDGAARSDADADGAQARHRRTIGFAAINALTASLQARAGWSPPTSRDSSGAIDPRPGERIGMVGLFAPLVDPIVRSGATLVVAELRADLAGPRDGWEVTLDADALRACDKVVSTGTLLLNDTLEPVLERCRHAREIALIGPTMGCVADPLFARGVTFIGGAVVEQPSAYLDALRTGAPRTGLSRKTGLRPRDYPGLDALLARVR